VNNLDDILHEVESYGAQANELVVKARNTLFDLYGKMFPKAKPPQELSALVNLFGADRDSLGKYSKAQTMCGAETALALAMAHGIQGDFNKAMSEMPKGPDGQEIALAPFGREARELAKKLAVLVEEAAKVRPAPEKTATAP